MSGKVSCGGGASPPGPSLSHRGQLAPHGPGGSPPARTAAAGAVTAVCALRRGSIPGTRSGRRARPGANFPDGVAAPGFGGVRAPGARGPRGPRQSKPPPMLSLSSHGGGWCGGTRGVWAPPRPAPPLPAAPAPPRGPRQLRPWPLEFGKQGAAPLAGKVPAVAAGGGRILTFSARRPQRERDADKQEPPGRGRGPSSEVRLHSFALGCNSLSAKKNKK